MRWWGALPLVLLPVYAGDPDDCGIVPGETYKVDATTLLRPDGSGIANWQDCYLPVGTVLSAGIVEVDPPHATRVRLIVTPPCAASDVWTITEVAKAKEYFLRRGVTEDGLVVELRACSTSHPLIDAVVTETSAAQPPEAPR
jgi:hypothetical protein